MKCSTYPLLLPLLVAAVLLAACGTTTDGGPLSLDEEVVAPGIEVKDNCVKFEDAAIGAAGLSFDFGTVSVSIDGWLEKGDSPGEQIGFDWTVVGGDVEVTVKAGRESHEATFAAGSGSWVHPAGTEGPEASAISNIVVCVPDADPGDAGVAGDAGLILF